MINAASRAIDLGCDYGSGIDAKKLKKLTGSDTVQIIGNRMMVLGINTDVVRTHGKEIIAAFGLSGPVTLEISTPVFSYESTGAIMDDGYQGGIVMHVSV